MSMAGHSSLMESTRPPPMSAVTPPEAIDSSDGNSNGLQRETRTMDGGLTEVTLIVERRHGLVSGGDTLSSLVSSR